MVGYAWHKAKQEAPGHGLHEQGIELVRFTLI